MEHMTYNQDTGEKEKAIMNLFFFNVQNIFSSNFAQWYD